MLSEQSPFEAILLGVLEREAQLSGAKARKVAVGRLGRMSPACQRCQLESEKGHLFCGGCGRPFGLPEEIANLTEKRALEKKIARLNIPS